MYVGEKSYKNHVILICGRYVGEKNWRRAPSPSPFSAFFGPFCFLSFPTNKQHTCRVQYLFLSFIMLICYCHINYSNIYRYTDINQYISDLSAISAVFFILNNLIFMQYFPYLVSKMTPLISNIAINHWSPSINPYTYHS